jgi:HAD superfamily hydrolase (TIGR01509 family)
MRFAELDAVTVDGYGTLVRLRDPIPLFRARLAERGVSCTAEAIRAGFEAEVAHYRPNALFGRDAETLAALRLECTRIFLEGAGVELEPSSFVDAFMASIVLEPIERAFETVRSLRARGLEVGVVSNWDVGLTEQLERLGAASLFGAIVTTAEAGAPKPEAKVFRLALERLGVDASRALHVGDEPGDAQGAAAAGMRFAPAPLASAFQGWT